MIVSRKRKFIFFHNPKAAGTSFRNSIANHHDYNKIFWGEEFQTDLNVKVDLAHLRAWELPYVAPELFGTLDQYLTVVFARNPARRFLSACFEHFRKFRINDRFFDQDAEVQRSMIRSLIRSGLTNIAVLADFRFVHFSLQSWYIFLGHRRLADHILPLHSGCKDFNSAYDLIELPRQTIRLDNQSAPYEFSRLMCAEFMDFVHRFYEADYSLLSSFDHLRPLVEDEQL